jgi:hypothetical protein
VLYVLCVVCVVRNILYIAEQTKIFRTLDLKGNRMLTLLNSPPLLGLMEKGATGLCYDGAFDALYLGMYVFFLYVFMYVCMYFCTYGCALIFIRRHHHHHHHHRFILYCCWSVPLSYLFIYLLFIYVFIIPVCDVMMLFFVFQVTPKIQGVESTKTTWAITQFVP